MGLRLGVHRSARFGRLTVGTWGAVVVLVGLVAQPAAAVVITLGNGQTGTDPSNSNTANVGISSTGNGSVTYLGNDWAITANHVYTGSVGSPANVTIGGVSYPVNETATTQLTNPDSSLADLKLIQIETGGANPAAPALSTLQIDSSSPALGTTLEMDGNGQSLNVGGGGSPVQYYWHVTGPPSSPTWTQTTAPGNASGYETVNGNALRYGENDVSATTGGSPVNDGSGYNTDVYMTQFNNSLYTGGTIYADEAQGTSGDSGGAVFTKVGSQWVLSGIMVAEAEYTNQPTNVTPPVASGNGTAIFGDVTYIADLSEYRSQILPYLVPEPSSAVLAALGAFALLLAAARRRG